MLLVILFNAYNDHHHQHHDQKSTKLNRETKKHSSNKPKYEMKQEKIHKYDTHLSFLKLDFFWKTKNLSNESNGMTIQCVDSRR